MIFYRIKEFNYIKEEYSMKASVAIQVLPGVTENVKICEVVDKCIEYIKAQGLKTFVSPFETTIEGELDQLIDIVKQCQYIAIEAGAPSVMSYVKIDFNPTDGILTINQKTDKYLDGNNEKDWE